MVFRSKVGLFYWSVLAFCWGLPLLLGTMTGVTTMAFMLLVTAGLPTWMLNTRYEFREHELRVICGPFRSKVSYSDIKRVEETGSVLSGAALSMDRLAIYGPRGVVALVSPNNKEAFVQMIRERSTLEDA